MNALSAAITESTTPATTPTATSSPDYAAIKQRQQATWSSGDYAVVGDFEGALHWLRLNDGAFAARSNLSGAITGQPAVADNILVVQTIDGQLAAFALQ